jgi:hypothetical protein
VLAGKQNYCCESNVWYCYQTQLSPRNNSAAVLVPDGEKESSRRWHERQTVIPPPDPIYRIIENQAALESSTPRNPRPAQIQAKILLHCWPGVKESNDLPKNGGGRAGKLLGRDGSAARQLPRRRKLERGEGNPRTEWISWRRSAAAAVTGGGVGWFRGGVVMAGEKHPGTGTPLGAGLFCNLSPCLVYFMFSPFLFWKLSILLCASMGEARG